MPWTTLLALAFSAVILALSFSNLDVAAPVTFAGYQVDTLPLGVIILVSAIIGGDVVYFFMLNRLQQGMQQAGRKLERAEVTAESSSEKVKALESKVQTLETALEKALSKTDEAKAGEAKR
ncbi:MAG: hypothetical protein KTR14_02140 [Vampirovibrio sp.]|nr:hypothetical protein [Vampirovibrio sp.]